MNPRDKWRRTGRGLPCPICNHRPPSGCMVATDLTAAICIRLESGKPTRLGWVHKLGGGITAPIVRDRVRPEPPTPTRDWHQFACECREDLPDQDDLPDQLGVSHESLGRLGYGWSREHGCYTFPMTRSDWKVVGIRTRYRNGAKRCITGSRTGLFMPHLFEPKSEVWVCEGPTDCAALLTLGFNAVARPSNVGGHDEMVRLLASGRGDVVIVADRESAETTDRTTLSAAERLAADLKHRRCKIVRPPANKDVRDWMSDGATAATLRWFAHGGTR